MSDPYDPRPAKQVIDDAIRENRFATNLLYGYATIFVLAGFAVIIIGIINNDIISGVLGTVATTLFYPAITAARRTRKESIAIRLLETPLSRADTAQDAAVMLRELVENILNDPKSDG